MARKGSWLSAVKKVFSSESKEKRDKKTLKSKGWFGIQKSKGLDVLQTKPSVETLRVTSTEEEKKLTEAENEKNMHVYSVALATAAAAAAAEAAVAAAKAAAEIVRLTNVSCYSGKSKEEMAAIKIQTAFRGYMARRAFRAVRGLVRLKIMIQGQSVKRQATVTLKCMQTLARVQSEVRTRRIKMSEGNESLQRRLQQKHLKELEKIKIADNWNDSNQLKEQTEAKQQGKQEAAIRRERALAYAYTHQQTWRNTPTYTNQTFMDPKNPHWGWSWLEQWMASRPWQPKTATEKEPNNDNASAKSTESRAFSAGKFQRTKSHRDDNKPSPSAQRKNRSHCAQSPSTPCSKAPTSSTGARKLRSPSTRGSNHGMDDDLQSMCSAQSEYHRRQSIAGSSVRDDESLGSFLEVPSYMTPTESAKAKSKLPSPLGLEKNGALDRGSIGSTKKRLSFSGSPASSRRHSGPPKIEISTVKGINATS